MFFQIKSLFFTWGLSHTNYVDKILKIFDPPMKQHRHLTNPLPLTCLHSLCMAPRLLSQKLLTHTSVFLKTANFDDDSDAQEAFQELVTGSHQNEKGNDDGSFCLRILYANVTQTMLPLAPMFKPTRSSLKLLWLRSTTTIHSWF